MATLNIDNVSVLLRRDTASNWATENPALLAGEMGVETDTLKGKIGDGSTTWNNLSYAFQDIDMCFDDIEPIDTKTYTGLYANPNNFAGGTFYFAKVIPDNYYKPWKVVYKLHVYVPSYTNYDGVYIVTVSGCQSSITTYIVKNLFYSVSYRPTYNHVLYRATQVGAATYGHLLGERIYYATNGNSATYARTIEVELLSQEDCTATLFNSAVKYADVSGSGETNYAGYSEFNATAIGFFATGVVTANTYDRTLLANIRLVAGTNGIKQYSLVMQRPNGTWESFTTTHGTGTTKPKNANGFILGRIWYFNTANNIASGSLTTATNYIYDCIPLTFSYSSNCGTTLVERQPVYLVGTIGSDGLFYLADTWWTQTAPTTEDGKVYIYLGDSYSTSAIYKVSYNPVYWYKDGAFREYAYATSSGGSVAWSDVTGKPTFATVATSGSYNDLSDKPTIPSAYTLPTASSTTLGGVKVGTNLSISNGVLSATDTKAWADITGKPTFATVATSGSYNDLSNKPTIPTVPSAMTASEASTGTSTTARTITAKVLSDLINTRITAAINSITDGDEVSY